MQIPANLNIVHKTIQIGDDPFEDLLVHLADACAFVDDALQPVEAETVGAEVQAQAEDREVRVLDREVRILVHCFMGVSRSGSVIIACLMKRLNLTYAAALERAQLFRPIIGPNEGFVEQLGLWCCMGFDVWEEEEVVEEGGVAIVKEKVVVAVGGKDGMIGGQGRKQKELYRNWQMTRNETAISQGLDREKAKSVASMAARFGGLRMKMQGTVEERSDGESSKQDG